MALELDAGPPRGLKAKAPVSKGDVLFRIDRKAAISTFDAYRSRRATTVAANHSASPEARSPQVTLALVLLDALEGFVRTHIA